MNTRALAWEQPGWSVNALWETTLQVVKDPAGAITSPPGPEVPLKPFVFAGLASLASALGAWVVSLGINQGVALGASLGMHLISGLVSWGIFLPILTWILSLVLDRLFHAPSSDFATCLRTLSYSYVTSVAGIIPIIGGIAALVWWFWMLMQMLPALHGLSRKQAFAAACLLLLATLVLTFLLGLIIVGMLRPHTLKP